MNKGAIFYQVVGVLLLAYGVITLSIRSKNRKVEKPVEPENPNKSTANMRYDLINGGFFMFRNPGMYWDEEEKTKERWHGPMVCWCVDNNNLCYQTCAGKYYMVRDMTDEEKTRLAREVLKTNGLLDLCKEKDGTQYE